MYCFSTSFCFLCLKHYPKTDLLDINKNKIRDAKIVDVLKECGIDSNYCNNSYQVYVCEKCIKEVEPFYAFKQKCSNNFLKLKGYVNQMKSNANVVFHANLKVLLSDPKYGDINETIEYMDMSQFVEAQIQTDEMEVQQQETPKEFDKPPEILEIENATNVTTDVNNTVSTVPEGNNIKNTMPLNNEQIYEITKYIYDSHFMNMPESDFDDEVIELASSPESFNDIPQKTAVCFNNMIPKHQCKVCNKCFTNPAQLSVHTFLHTLLTYPDNEANKSMKYYCALCTENLIGLAEIKKHLFQHTLDKIFTCEYCKVDFMVYLDYNRHLSLNPTHKPYSCKLCVCRFMTARKLSTHIKKKHELGCMFCKSCFPNKVELKVHMKQKHNSKFCNICATSFKTNNSLKKHLFDNHFELQTIGLEGKPQYNCTKCRGEFLTKYSLNEHLVDCKTEKNTS